MIVRHKHLFVLYGHLRELDPGIYVGKQVNAGTLLGQIGTATNPNPNVVVRPHVHIEVRSFGATIPTAPSNDTDPLVKDVNEANNPYGVLANAGISATNIYEPAQFFAANVVAFSSDSNSTAIAVTGLGKAIVDEGKVTIETTSLPDPCGMPLSNGKPQLTYCSGVVGTDVQQTTNGYRGFKLGVGTNFTVPPDVEPNQVTTAP